MTLPPSVLLIDDVIRLSVDQWEAGITTSPMSSALDVIISFCIHGATALPWVQDLAEFMATVGSDGEVVGWKH